MRRLTLLLFALLFSFNVFSQKNSKERLELDWSTLALGTGFGYGGWGFSYTAFPQKNIGFFAAGGVIWGDFGYNLGVKVRLISDQKKHKLTPYLKVMYGTNATFIINNTRYLNKKFYGLSYGGGIDFGFKATSERKAYFSFSILIPVIDEEVKKHNENIKENLEPKEIYGLTNLTFSVGYNVILGKK